MRNFIKSLIIITIPFLASESYAQVGIGNTSPNGALDISSTNEGLLIPRIALSATNIATIATPTTSELVYNTATSAAGPNQVTPGFYYWDSTSSLWIRISTGKGDDWTLSGNSGTTAGINFIGTTDAQDLRFKTGGNDRLNISNTNGQIQSFFGGSAATPAFSWATDANTGVYRSAADNLSLATNGIEALRVQSNANITIGATYAPANAAPTNGLRVEGQTIIGKPSGEDSRDKFSAHTSVTSYNNVTGYPNATAGRALSGYADTNGMGVFGFSNRTGYGVVGLTQANTLSNYIQTGEGVLGQSDGASGGPTIPIGVHGIIDESNTGNWKANGVTGENNNLTAGTGLSGGSYAASGVTSGVYGNYASKFTTSGTDAYAFGVSGDILKIGAAVIPDGSGGVFGAGGAGQFAMLGYNSLNGTQFSVYGGGEDGDINSNNTGNNKTANSTKPNNRIGLGINGGFMGGYVKGNQYGMISKGEEFGMYVQGNTIVNQPLVQLTDNGNSERTVSYTAASTSVDITTRGTGKLRNGEAFIAFKDAFKDLVSKKEGINVTVTPTSETNGVYISSVSPEGFYIKENQNGNSNASFNWVAIGTKAGYENGIEISKTILAQDFDKNMDGVMNNDGSKKEGTPIHFNGQDVKFERIPNSFIQNQKKEASKKN